MPARREKEIFSAGTAEAPRPLRTMSDGSGISTGLEIAVSLHDVAWLEACADLEAQAEAAVIAVLRPLKLAGESLEISLVFTDDAGQRSLNRNYRMKDPTTNEISLPRHTGSANARTRVGISVLTPGADD